MVATHEIVDAYVHVHPDGVERWTIVVRDDTGTQYAYVMPSDTCENLAVEYGLPEDDIDTLLKVAMLQCHIPEPRHPANHASDPAAKKGHVRKGRPIVLENADSTDQAREAHLERIRWVESNLVRIVEPKPGKAQRMVRALDVDPDTDVEVDPHSRLAALKATYRTDKDRIREKKRALGRALGREI